MRFVYRYVIQLKARFQMNSPKLPKIGSTVAKTRVVLAIPEKCVQASHFCDARYHNFGCWLGPHSRV